LTIAAAPQGPESATDEFRWYAERALACTDAQEIAEVTSLATRDLAPNQLSAIYKRIEALAEPARLALFESNGKLWRLLTRREPPGFDNLRIAANARLFVAHDVSRADKVLLVVFSGAGGGMFISTMRLLMRLPRGRFDVLWLWPADGADYPHGVPGFADSFAGVCDRVRGFTPGYGGVAAIGGSLGGYSALRAGLVLDLPVAVSLSGRFSSLMWAIDKPSAPAFDPLCACLGPRRTTLTAYYSADHPLDAVQADKLAAMNPSVQGVAMPTHDHNVLAQLMADGGFDTVFEGIYRRAMGQAADPLHEAPRAPAAADLAPDPPAQPACSPEGLLRRLARAAIWLRTVIAPSTTVPGPAEIDGGLSFNGEPVVTRRSAPARKPLPRRWR
jgi:hypothetical protein